ncbi:MAG: hypothetical protein S4CHLAM27_12570 [Chlamydiia bacterium]|nr:hypothetical protein [Chlamydiia bacterium]
MCTILSINVFEALSIQKTEVGALRVLEQDQIVQVAMNFFNNILDWGINRELNAESLLKGLQNELKVKVISQVEDFTDIQKKINTVLYIAHLPHKEAFQKGVVLQDTRTCIKQLALEVFLLKKTTLFDSDSWRLLTKEHEIFKCIEQIEMDYTMTEAQKVLSINGFIQQIRIFAKSTNSLNFSASLKQMEGDKNFCFFIPLLREVNHLMQSICLDRF